MQQAGALHLGSTQLRGTRLGNGTARQKAFILARRAKRSHSTRGSKAVTNIFGGNKKSSGGTLLIKLPQLPGSGGKDGQESGTLKMRKGQRSGGSDPNTIFVAGATGRLGARIVRELLSQGYRVRAGVRSIDKAENFVRTAANFGLLSGEELALLDVIPYNLEQPETFEGAIGNAGRVVCAVGAAESEFANLSSPKRIDGEGTIGLIEAAAKAGVTQFVLVTSLGTGKIGFPAALLNVFGGVLIYKRKAEEALERSGIPYVIVRPGGMERPRDDYKLTHNVRLAPRDQLFGGQVSRLQVAELVAACLGNTEAAQNKVLEVVAEAEAPALSWEDLLGSIPQEESPEEREAKRQREAELLEQLAEAREKLEAVEAQLATVKARVGAANSEAAELKKQEAAVRKEQADVLKQAQAIEAQLAKLSADADLKSRQAAAAKAVLAAAQQAQREQRVLPAAEIADIRSSILNPPKPREEKQESGTLFLSRGLGGLFGGKKAAQGQKQEEVEEEVEEKEPAAAAKPSGLGGLFGRVPPSKKEQPAEEDKEEEVVAKEEPEPAAAVATKALGGFRGLFGAKQQEQEEAASTVQELIAEEDSKAAQAKEQAEEDERKQAEAKAAAEQKAKEKEERAKAEAKEREEKAKAEAESRAKAEAAEAKARADAQAKAKAAAERKAKEQAQENADRKPVPVAVAAALIAPAAKAAEAAVETVAPDFKPFSGLLDYFGLGALGAGPAAPEGTPPTPPRVLPTGRGTPKEQTAEEKEAASAKAAEKVEAKKAQRAAAVPTGRGAPKAEQAQQAPAPAGGVDDRKAVEAAAAKNAAEARAWIQAWRERTAAAAAGSTAAPAAGAHANGAAAPKTSGSGQKAAEAKQAKVSAGNGAGPSHAAGSAAGQEVGSNVKEAREWIQAWKAKQSAK